MKIITKNVETIGSKNTSESITYEYETPADRFWTKSIHKNDDGEISKTVVRELGDDRTPVKELTYEFGDIITKTKIVKYSAENGKLLYEKVFDGTPEDNKPTTVREYEYAGERLVREKAEVYFADPDFVNEDGNRIRYSYVYRYVQLTRNCPQSDEHNLFVEELRSYANEDRGDIKKGDLAYIQFTEFDSDGMPVYFKSTEPKDEHHAVEAWYKIERNDDGTVSAIKGFDNKEMNKFSTSSTARIFTYGDGGMIESYLEAKYTPDTGEYDRQHAGMIFDWKFPATRDCGLARAEVESRSYCFHRQLLTLEQEKIRKYSDGTLVVEEYEGTKNGAFDPDFNDTKLTRRTTYKYEIIK
ncbi:MAG: hypothetical protein ACLFQX_07950 [Candidatus Kapaibacterium sp.]